MKVQNAREFTPAEHETWHRLYDRLDQCRVDQAHPVFARGLEKLGFSSERIPSLDEINGRLMKITGWQGIPVEGLEDGQSFFKALTEKKFPIGNFIRDAEDLNYTPAPDIFHDLYGHIPFFADQAYADFNFEFGQMASRYLNSEDAVERFGRLYWFGLEFPLIKTSEGKRIFGGGILSSFGESNYSLSDAPEVIPFNVKAIYDQEYRIDVFQKKIFILENEQQLYTCLRDFEQLIKEAA